MKALTGAIDFRYRLPLLGLTEEEATLECYAYYVGAFNYNWHRHVECLLVISGSIEVCSDGKTFILEEDDLCFIHSMVGHATLSKEKGTKVLVLHFEPNILQKINESSQSIIWKGKTDATNRSLQPVKSLREKLMHMVTLLSEGRNQVKLLQECLDFLSIASSLFSEVSDHGPSFIPHATEQGSMKTLIHYIRSHYQEKLLLSDLSKVIGYHPNYTSELFSKYTGIPFSEYLTRYRLSMATKKLKQTTKRIADIAYEQGFSSVKAFNTVFKTTFSRSPSAYRNALDEDTLLIDAEFKKVFLPIDNPDWIEALGRWRDPSEEHPSHGKNHPPSLHEEILKKDGRRDAVREMELFLEKLKETL